jgi:hypothetical protein
MDELPEYEFDMCVRRYRGNHRVRSLPAYEQFLVLAFAQLTYRESLRDSETCLRALGSNLYHSGLRQPTARSTLADANEKRDWRLSAADRRAGYRYDLSVLQAEFSLTQVGDRGPSGRSFFEEVIRENCALLRPIHRYKSVESADELG